MLFLKNCRVLAGESLVECNVQCDEESGKIRRVSRSETPSGADRTIDCTGLVAIPGMVDTHVHFRDPGQTDKEDFYSGSAGALAGGTTTVMDMPNNSPAVSTLKALGDKLAVISPKAVCDYALFFGATPTNQEEAAKAALEPSVCGLKVYLGSSTGDLLVDSTKDFEAHMRAFPRSKPVFVHAEYEHDIRRRTEELRKKDSKGRMEYHNAIRNPEAAAISVDIACDMASRTHRSVHVCHVSTKNEIDIISTFKKSQVPVTVEVCPHHLFLTENDTARLGNYAKVNPPLRSRTEAAALWDEISRPNSIIDCIGSDHAPHTKEEKERDYWDAPSGVPGVQARGPLMIDAVGKKLITIHQLVRYCSANPAKIFSLKSKGAIAEGMDADITLIDLKESYVFKAEDQLSKCGWTPYEGRKLTGKIRTTVLRGKVAFDGENVCIKRGEGRAVISDCHGSAVG